MMIPCYTGVLVLAYGKKEKGAPAARYDAGNTYGTGSQAQKGYRGLAGFPSYIKRRPRRLNQTMKCCYCGETANNRPIVAMAVNSSGRFVDTQRLSAPHCKNCGIMVA